MTRSAVKSVPAVSSFIDDALVTLKDADAAQSPPIHKFPLGPCAANLRVWQSRDAPDPAGRLLRACISHDKGSKPVAGIDLHICVGPETPIGLPPPDWPFPIDDRNSFQRVFWNPAGHHALTSDEQSGVWNLMDPKAGLGLIWIRDLKSLPGWEYSSPLRHHFHWSALMNGSTLVHAAAFDTPSGAIMLTGPGGSGKSTTTAAAIVHGWTIIGEDLCWVECDQDKVFAHRLYNTLKITNETRSQFRFIDDLVESHDHEQFEKTIVYLDETLLARERGELRAIFCLSGAFGSKTIIAPCSKGLAFRLIAPSTLFLMRTASVETTARLRALVDRLPTFHVTLGADPMEVVAALARFAGELP